jgi:YfiH family protein
MTDRASDLLCDRVLVDCGIAHGFGQRGSQPPDSTIFPKQVHGIDVCEIKSSSDMSMAKRREADILFSREPGICIGIVTADCLPILVAAADGSVVAAIHAGWRGLAAGVIETGLQAIRNRSEAATVLVAAVGPAAGSCCYEVDQPVRHGLALRYAKKLNRFLSPGRAGHFQLDLPGFAVEILINNGVEKHRIGIENCICTICSGTRFESHRRDGTKAGRLRHFISAPGSSSVEG